MESNIKVKAKRDEMGKVFDESPGFSIRSYEELRPGLFKVRVRHKEMEEYLTGTFTIDELKNALK